jgi:hypothetical protein
MARMVLGVFSEKLDAEDAIQELEDHGFNPKDMSIIMKDRAEGEAFAQNTGTNVAEGALTGATTGGVLGALAGLLVGIGAVTIPGIGAIFIAGPIATALGLTGAAGTTVSGALTGILAGGLVGGLMGLGVPEEDAKVYEDRIKAGAILLAVPASEVNEAEIKDIMDAYQADQIRVIDTRGESRRSTPDEYREDKDYQPAYAHEVKRNRGRRRVD